ncbi:FAD-binding protein [Amycolatopsis sp. NPDC049253]|uniref:FAD-binding protein n=1 Tax=Amycolatopsis sp. NPDC049253 TaxID=3155274 RepID=UPI003441E303
MPASTTLPLAVRSGGHGISGRSTLGHGVVLDLGRMNSVEILDRAKRLVRLEPGARRGDVAQVLAQEGLAMNSGDHGDVGAAGSPPPTVSGTWRGSTGSPSTTSSQAQLVPYSAIMVAHHGQGRSDTRSGRLTHVTPAAAHAVADLLASGGLLMVRFRRVSGPGPSPATGRFAGAGRRTSTRPTPRAPRS